MIIQIAFNFLFLVMLAIACYFAYVSIRQRFEAEHRQFLAKLRTKLRQANKRLDALEADYSERLELLEKAASTKEAAIKSPPNPFTRSEERHIQEGKKATRFVEVASR